MGDRTPRTISSESLDGVGQLFCAISLIVHSFTFWDLDPAGSRTIELLYAPEIGLSIEGAIDRILSFLCHILEGISARTPVWRAIDTALILGGTPQLAPI